MSSFYVSFVCFVIFVVKLGELKAGRDRQHPLPNRPRERGLRVRRFEKWPISNDADGPQSLPARLGPAAGVAAAVAAAAAAESARTLRFRTRLVHGQTAAAQLELVQLVDRLLRFFVCAHFNEREAARPAGGHVAHDLHRFDRARAGEQVLKIGFPGFVRKVANVKSTTHQLTPLSRNATIRSVAKCDHRRADYSARVPTVQSDPWVDFVSSPSGISGGASWKDSLRSKGSTALSRLPPTHAVYHRGAVANCIIGRIE